MIELSEFDISHGSHLVGIQERTVYTYMVIIIGKVRSDLINHIRLGYDMGPWGWLGVTHVLWYRLIASRDEPRESCLKELRISLIWSVKVKLSIYN